MTPATPLSVEHEKNIRVNCVKSQDRRQTLAGEARTKAGNDLTFKMKKNILLFFITINTREKIVEITVLSLNLQYSEDTVFVP